MIADICSETMTLSIGAIVDAHVDTGRVTPEAAIAILIEVARYIGDAHDCADDGKDQMQHAIRSDWSEPYRHLEVAGQTSDLSIHHDDM